MEILSERLNMMEHDSLTGRDANISDSLKGILNSAKSENTRKAYLSDFNQFMMWDGRLPATSVTTLLAEGVGKRLSDLSK